MKRCYNAPRRPCWIVHRGEPGQGTGGLANLLLNSYQERLIQNRLQEEQEKEDGALEEEEEDDDYDDRDQQKEWEPTPEEKALLREEFISQMHQRFLDGKDKDFNYRSVTQHTGAVQRLLHCVVANLKLPLTDQVPQTISLCL
uniref:CCD97-like C-terminal domain-containing protein n=1 Tax=Oreochromis aureus TaxID=47969 RepID=A0AAZ1X0G4_OREAU